MTLRSDPLARTFPLRLFDRLRADERFSNAMTSALRPLAARSDIVADWCVHHLPRVGAASVEAPTGVAFAIRSPGHHEITNRLFWGGVFGYESATARVLYDVFQGSAFFLDVGANVGYFSCLALAANPNILVAAFEPMPRNFATLSSNLMASFPEALVVPMRLALSDRSGTVEMQHAGDRVQVRSAIARDSASDLPCRSLVQTARYDDVRSAFNRTVDVVKIDVEGSEDLVLAGMRDTIAMDQPIVCVEVLSDVAGEGVRDALHGYTPFAITNTGLRAVVGDWRRRTEERNFLWVPEPRMAMISRLSASGLRGGSDPGERR